MRRPSCDGIPNFPTCWLERRTGDHDFDHIGYRAEEFDARRGLPGLHTVKLKVSAPERETVLPPDLFKRFVNDSFWLDPKNNVRNVPVV